MTPAERSARLLGLVAEGDPLRRCLVALGILTERLAQDGIEPILVGGAAVAFYTAGGYSSVDVDVALPIGGERRGAAVERAFVDLGFTRRGRFWVYSELDLLFEIVAREGLPGEEAPRTRVAIDGLPITVVGLEDLVLDRLRAWVHWRSEEDERWGRRLCMLYADRLDWDYLERKCVGDVELFAARQLREELSPQRAEAC